MRRAAAPKRLIVAATAVASAAAISVPFAQVAQAAPRPAGPTSGLVQVTGKAKLPDGARVLGAVSSSTEQTGAVALRLGNSAAATNFIDEVSNPRSADYRDYLAKGQFASRFGPSSSAVSAVEHQLRADGLTVTGVSANRLLVSFKGTTARVDAAFHTGLSRVQLQSGRIGQTTTSALRLPGSIARDVTAVVGLDQLVQETNGLAQAATHGRASPGAAAKSAASDGGPVACAAAQAVSEEYSSITDQQVAASYGLDPLYAAGDLGAGQTIDIYELEPFLTSDIQAFDECYFGADHTSQLTTTLVDGGPETGPGSAEAALDIEDVSALAPGAKIHVFDGPNMDDPFGPLDTWNAIAEADDANQISSSWGECEAELQQGAPGVQQVENEIFEQTAAQGQTVFSAAGDDGSDSCSAHDSTPVAPDLSVLDPASQPYVTSVGGTTITDASEPPVETVWNNGDSGGAGGGGISETWAMPPWQDSVAVKQTSADEACSNDPSGTADVFHLQGIPTTLPAGTTCRETPDVSALADPQSGITIYYDGFWTVIGGTSSATPLWAAMLAEINASNGCSRLTHGVGFADPLFYQIASSSPTAYADAFNDITVGNNDNLGVSFDGQTAWPAGKGYDLASGLGTPRITDANGSPGLASQLCAAAAGSDAAPRPAVSSLSPGTGPAAGGGTVTIAGSNFGTTAGSVFFGSTRATVVSWSASSITVDLPAYYAPDGTASGVAGRADVTVVTAAGESSGLGADSVFRYTANSAGAPVVDYVSSSNGPVSGGNTVDIVGAGFTGATAVDFGGAAATSFTVSSDNEIKATVPPDTTVSCAVPASQGMCAAAVTVTTPDGTSSGPTILPAYQGPIEYSPNGAFVVPAGYEVVPAPEEYDYAPAPHITSVSPAYASENGTSVDTITGTGFNLLTFEWVNVGPANMEFSQNYNLEGVSPTQVTIAIPPNADTTEPASVPLSVDSAGQLSNTSAVVYAGTPELTSISKHLAAQADPGSLTITGKGLSDVSSVVFQVQGSLSFLTSTSTTISDQTDTSLTVAIPQAYSFPSDVLVCSVTGCSAPDPKVDSFLETYAGRPVLSSSSPSSGPAHGGTQVVIQGELDSYVTAVDFGSRPATILQFPEGGPSGPVIVLAPPGKAGTKVDITITTLGGLLTSPPQPRSAVTTAAVFTYQTSSPTAPTHVVAKAGVKSATVSWWAPSNNGGSPVTGYRITATAKGHKSVVVKVSAGVRKATVKKLAAGVSWTLTVQAVNKRGAGLPAASNTVKPRS
jgi:Pro-kumamolisin, activation domain/IPT/TIG domain/Fibronectin type III domain